MSSIWPRLWPRPTNPDPLAEEVRRDRHGRLGATNLGTREDAFRARDRVLHELVASQRAAADLRDALAASMLGGPVADEALLVDVLVEHEQLADDTCRCGWGDDAPHHPEAVQSPLWHAEHVAAELAATVRRRLLPVVPASTADTLPLGTIVRPHLDSTADAAELPHAAVRIRDGWWSVDLQRPEALAPDVLFEVVHMPMPGPAVPRASRSMSGPLVALSGGEADR